jgi:Pyruvate/2-oxoacid:ferredoxin oxidoreductase delta subunit
MRWHLQCGRNYEYFARLLVELAYTIKPSLSIIDAVIGMEGNGPSSGTPRKLGFIGASEDMLSLDSVCTEIAGINPDKNYCLKVANEMGFKTDLKDIPLKGDPVNQFRMDDFKPASTMAVDGPPILQPFLWILRPLCTVKPFVNKDLCKGCGICMKACPPQSISLPESKAVVSIDHNKCIRCFCCQELCPEGAIHAKDPIGVKIMKALGLE